MMCDCGKAENDVLEREDFKRCVAFHGHVCPGLSIGYKAAIEGMKRLKEERAEDEETVAIVETDACSADAVQVLTGCTFGKGNFIYKDYGKMVLTLFSRNSGEGVRIAMRPNMMTPSEEHGKLLQKIQTGDITAEERKRFYDLHLQRSIDILSAPAEKLFNITKITMDQPPKAVMAPSEICEICGEPAMGTKMETVDNRKVCRACL